MAFFKFRFPGNASEAASEGLSATSGESMEALRRRARHRLFGSVVLVFAAVVAFPLLFDSQPRPVAVDTPIVIPDRNGTPPLAVGAVVPVAQAPAKPLLPAAAASAPAEVPAQASLDSDKEEVVAPTPMAKVPAPHAEAVASKPEPQVESKPEPKAKTEPKSKPEPKVEPKKEPAKATVDSQKAKALLEGKDGKSASADAAKVIIQVGAFADADKARDVRRKLEHAGLKTFTQSIEGKDGKRSTRVRVGPFETRAEADKAAARVRKLDLPANVIVL